MSTNNEIKKAKALRMDKSDEWVIERMPISIEIEELGENVRPEVLVCVSLKTGVVIGASVIAPSTPDSEISSWAVGCMLSPMVGQPRRPGRVNTYGSLGNLASVLEQMEIEVSTLQKPHPLVDEVISELENTLSEPELPPYITDSKPDPALVAEFFEATAEFYALQPWKLLEYEMPAKVELRMDKPVTYWAIVMGVGGEEYGLSLFRSAEELLAVFDAETEEEALEVSENTSSLGFAFDDFDSIGPSAQAERLEHGWTLPDPSAYPSAISVDPASEAHVRRPNETELTHLTAVTLAITDFLRKYQKQIRDEEYVEDSSIEVEVSGKPVGVTIAMPAPEFLEDEDDE